MTDEYLSAILTHDLQSTQSLQLLETFCGLHTQEVQEGVIDGIDLHLECEDDGFGQPVYSEVPNLLPHTVTGQNVCLRVTFPPPADDLDTNTAATFHCTHCEVTFPKQYKLAKHLLDVHAVTKNFQCPECLFATTSTRLLRRHHLRRHLKKSRDTKLTESEVACVSSGHSDDEDRTQTKPDVHSIQNSHDNVFALKSGSPCEGGQVPPTPTTGVPHVDQKQCGQYLYICSSCPYKCHDLRSLNSHAGHKHDPNREDFTCTQCSFHCKQKRTLIIHQKTHSDDAPFQCDVCKKKFAVQSALNRHSKIHTDEKSFICMHENCNKAFKSKELLKGHVSRVHDKGRATGSNNGKSLFVCSWEDCGKTFRDNYNLKVHYCGHTGDKPLHCQQCKFTCVQKASLNHHLKTIHS